MKSHESQFKTAVAAAGDGLLHVFADCPRRPEMLCSDELVSGGRHKMSVTVHIPDSLGPRLKQAAETEGLSLSALTAKALEFYLKRKRESGIKLLTLISPDAVSEDAWEELERGRGDDDRA